MFKEFIDFLKSFEPYNFCNCDVVCNKRGLIFDCRKQLEKFMEGVKNFQEKLKGNIKKPLNLTPYKSIYVRCRSENAHLLGDAGDELVRADDFNDEVPLEYLKDVKHSKYLKQEDIRVDFFQGKKEIEKELESLEKKLKEYLDLKEYPNVKIHENYKNLLNLYKNIKDEDIIIKIDKAYRTMPYETVPYEIFKGHIKIDHGLRGAEIICNFICNTDRPIYDLIDELNGQIK